MRTFLTLILIVSTAPAFAATDTDAPNPQKFVIEKRASEIDPRARAHPEINFVFADAEGKAKDLQHAVVDTRVAPQGKLVIWLMGYRKELFDRTSSYGLHSIQVHYANGWFSKVSKQVGRGTGLGAVRLEAATGEDHSPLVEIPKPDGMQERAFQFVKWLADANPEGNWGQFINGDGNGLDWGKVVVAGASHGSTTAARFAKHQRGRPGRHVLWTTRPARDLAGSSIRHSAQAILRILPRARWRLGRRPLLPLVADARAPGVRPDRERRSGAGAVREHASAGHRLRCREQ